MKSVLPRVYASRSVGEADASRTFKSSYSLATCSFSRRNDSGHPASYAEIEISSRNTRSIRRSGASISHFMGLTLGSQVDAVLRWPEASHAPPARQRRLRLRVGVGSRANSRSGGGPETERVSA